MTTLLLLPSPLLPATAYEPLADALRDDEYDVRLVDASDPVSGSRLIDRWAAAARILNPDAVVAHSNAGYLAPSVRAALAASAPIVFVDAALPPAPGSTRLAPTAFRKHLAGLADDTGTLPPWTRWWPEADLAEVVPEALRASIDAACPRLPLAYFDSEVTPPTGWADGANAYLGFGDTYADEIALGRARGWPVVTMPGEHLHFLHDAARVAREVGSLLDRL